ncbi:hypothetical protein GCM10027417_14200 [Glutamicibacter endophyticus]
MGAFVLQGIEIAVFSVEDRNILGRPTVIGIDEQRLSLGDLLGGAHLVTHALSFEYATLLVPFCHYPRGRM